MKAQLVERNCKHIVTYTEQILEPGHVWKLDHQYEAAALFNSVAPDGVNIGPAREEKLAQGWYPNGNFFKTGGAF